MNPRIRSARRWQRRVAIAGVVLLAHARGALAQERGAVALADAMRGLAVNTRVLVIGAHPDDEDTQLIAWLARGRQVETAYLSLTRGDGGQNLIGNELGEALGAIRTEELLAARRLDGGHQYFTRAFDFGFSKSAEETYRHWPKDSILRDVVTVVRAFRPHVIVAVFSGTPRDGHGHHQVSGLLAREAYDVAGDAARLPSAATHGLAPWAPLEFYRAARYFGLNEATYRFDVGEYSPLRGQSFAELAAASRSQHRSQAMGSLQRKGALLDGVRLEATRTGTTLAAQQSLFDGMDTTWARIGLGALGARIAEVQRAFSIDAPERSVAALVALDSMARAAASGTAADGASADRRASLGVLRTRLARAIQLASGLGIDATSERETWAADETARASVALFDRALPAIRARIRVDGNAASPATDVAPGATASLGDTLRAEALTQPWWLARPRTGDIFAVPIDTIAEDRRQGITATIDVSSGGAAFPPIVVPIVHRYADPTRGEQQRPMAIVPAIAVTVDQPVQYVPAGRAFERIVRVRLRSASDHPRIAVVSLQLPAGITADSASRTIALPDYAGSFGPEGGESGPPGARAVAASAPTRDVEFHIRGTVAEGRHTLAAIVTSEGRRYDTGYTLVDYEHIRPQRLYRTATVTLSAVNLVVASGRRVAYVPGVGDNVAPMLEQLGVPVTVIAPERVAATDLSAFTTVVIGPRAYESSPALVASNPRLFDFARAGGTLVVQYGQFEMANPGMMPYPVTIVRPGDRVTEEDAVVTVTDSTSPILAGPNRIGARDWAGWVQERTLYMPRTHDPRYRSMLSMHDSGEPPNDGAILVAPLGRGAYVYTTLALFRQLPAGVPGAARLFANLLSADERAAGGPPPAVRP